MHLNSHSVSHWAGIAETADINANMLTKVDHFAIKIQSMRILMDYYYNFFSILALLKLGAWGQILKDSFRVLDNFNCGGKSKRTLDLLRLEASTKVQRLRFRSRVLVTGRQE